ncbi:MAG: hypothetical protein U7123_28250 [Potamolinea sp.]
MRLTLLNQLGEWNPQFFREIKGQFKTRNLLLVVASSFVTQFLLMMVSSRQECIRYVGSNCAQYNQHIEWVFIFRTLNWILPLLLLICGVYLLIGDVGKEERKGTLNFIRLSPQSSQSILTGKILGVPFLLYLAIALTIPLHFVAGAADNKPLLGILGIYLLWGVGCALFYNAALLYTLQCSASCEPKSLAGAGSLLAFFLASLYISIIDFSFNWYGSGSDFNGWQWFFLPLGSQSLLAFAWLLITVSVASYWFWQATNRRFRNSNATLLSKGQSYWLVCSLQIWLLGFALSGSNSNDSQLFIGGFALFVFNPISMLIVNAALSPCRQVLQDWARYQHQGNSPQNKSLLQDLIWGEKSPPLLAIALNLLITVAIWLPGIFLQPQQVWSNGELTMPKLLLGLLMTMNAVLIASAITQFILLMKATTRNLFAVGTVSVVIVLPLVALEVVGIELLKFPFIWLLSPLPIIGLGTASATTVFLGLLTQFGVLGLLVLQLTKTIRKMGESGSKALLTERRLLPHDGLK